MSLTQADVSTIRDVIFDAFEVAMNPRFDALEKDMEELKGDVRVLKEDVKVLKEDVRVLKEDVRILKEDVRSLQVDMREVKSTLHNLDGRVEALEADVKELYGMIAKQQSPASNTHFAKLSFEQKIQQTYQDVVLLAKEAGVTLPPH